MPRTLQQSATLDKFQSHQFRKCYVTGPGETAHCRPFTKQEPGSIQQLTISTAAGRKIRHFNPPSDLKAYITENISLDNKNSVIIHRYCHQYKW